MYLVVLLILFRKCDWHGGMVQIELSHCCVHSGVRLGENSAQIK